MRRIIVTGGNSGIGKETVRLFLEQGDAVIFTSRSNRLSMEMLNEFDQYMQEKLLYFFQCDSSKSADVQKLVRFADETIGGCDVIVNSAAIFIGGEVHDMDESDFDLQMGINVKGVFLTCKYFLPQMIAQGKGCIVNISSLAGLRGGYNCAVYGASKAAVNNFTRCIGLDYMEHGIRANAICPSATSTKMFLSGSTQEVIDMFKANNPARRISKPDEIAQMVLFLAWLSVTSTNRLVARGSTIINSLTIPPAQKFLFVRFLFTCEIICFLKF